MSELKKNKQKIDIFEGDTIKIKDVLENYDKMGIPHFQRGQIWKADNKAAFIESLFFDIPCGSIYLWKPNPKEKNINRFGEGLEEKTKFSHLIVDGQQRITTLYEIFKSINNKYENKAIWCMNLVKLNRLIDDDIEFKDLNKKKYLLSEIIKIEENNRIREQSLFRLIKYPQNESHIYHNRFLPLKFLLSNFEKDKLEKIKKCIKILDLLKFEDILEIISERTKIIFGRKLFIKEITNQAGEMNEDKFSEIIHIYNKINSEGMVAKPEELALSHLVLIHKKSVYEIEKLFKSIHGESADRNKVLKRQKENQFGFKLFIRTFILVCNYHFNIYIKSRNLSLDVFEKNEYVKNHIKNNNEIGKTLWEKTSSILTSFRNQILKNELFCDDLRFLPETNSLLPIFMMMLRYEKIIFNSDRITIKKEFIKPLSKLTLGFLINEEKDIYKVLNEIRLSAKSINDMFEKLFKNDAKILEKEAFELQLKNSNSIQSKLLKLLYWLERSRGVKDFSYKLNDIKHKSLITLKNNGESLSINESCNPEKQHLIPFSLLAGKDNLYPKSTRGGSHEPNNIGNLTYISQALNSLQKEGGLGEKPLILQDESYNIYDPHFFNRETIKQFEIVKIKPTRELFEEFVRNRRRLISDGFNNWYDEMSYLKLPKFQTFREQITLPKYSKNLNLIDQIINRGFDCNFTKKVIDILKLGGNDNYKWSNPRKLGRETAEYRTRHYLKRKKNDGWESVAYLDIFCENDRMSIYDYKSDEIFSHEFEKFQNKLDEIEDIITTTD